MSGPNRPRRPALGKSELQLLHAETRGCLDRSAPYTANSREQTTIAALCALGFWGLSAREISTIDIGDLVVGEQMAFRDQFAVVASQCRPTTVVTIPDGDRWLVRRYMRWRLSCPHFLLPLRTIRNELLDELCHACREPLEWAECPLFISRLGSPLGAHSIRRMFATLRDRLRLNPRLSFSSLRRTAFELGVATTSVRA